MVLGTSLRQALREVASSLVGYADDHGWKTEEYWIYYRIESEWHRIHIIFVSKNLDPAEELANYVSVRESLARRLVDHPDLLNHLGLIVRSYAQLEQGGIYAIGSEFEQYLTTPN